MQSGAAGRYGRQSEITIPSGLADGTYTLYVFSEQYNGGASDDTKLTDYASAFEAVTLTVSSDTTAPTLSGGSATRDSETAATVKFTSDEAGEYYYAVVESGEAAPDHRHHRGGYFLRHHRADHFPYKPFGWRAQRIFTSS